MSESMIQKLHQKRYTKTVDFIKKHIPDGAKILDLGTPNVLSEKVNAAGFSVSNTQGENLDTDFHNYTDTGVDVITAFEIFEHLLAPFNILDNLKTDKLIASVPLKLWFASAYWNEENDWDKHYHEFEVKQFNFLLEKTGWKIVDSELWTNGSWTKLGIRPFLRNFTPRHYIVYCERVV